MTMNTIKKIFFAIFCSMISITAWADSYKIESLNTVGTGTLVSSPAQNTDILYGNTVTLTVAPGDGFFLDKIDLEYVMDLGAAESRKTRGNGPDILTTGKTIARNESYKAARYGGTYTFDMPAYNVVITAYFTNSIPLSAENTTISISGDNSTYNGENRNLVVVYNDGSNHTLAENIDYTITGMTYNSVERTSGNYTIKDVGAYQATIRGIGLYAGDVTSNVLNITTKDLTITAQYINKIFGESDPALTYTSSGLCSGDAFTGSLARAAGENANTYAITIGSLSAGDNYNTTFNGATFTINPKNITGNMTYTPHLGEGSLGYFKADNSTHYATITDIVDVSKSATLVEGNDKDYYLTYENGKYGNSNFTQPDIYTVVVNFRGNYTGTFSLPYQIRKEIALSNNHRWMTIYEPTLNLRIPDNFGFEANTVKDIHTTGIVLEKKNFIKANTPMIIYRTGNEYSFYPEIVESTEGQLSYISSNSAFKGVSDNTAYDNLNIAEGNQIWILVDDQFVRTNSGEIPAGKCYLELPKVEFFTPSLSLARGTTGIGDGVLVEDNGRNDIYDLMGRRISNPKKGLYIKNGKKIIIR